jgi:POT family proton-dependent oligopeptide transporter
MVFCGFYMRVYSCIFLIVSPRLKERNYITDPYVDNKAVAEANNL